MSKKSKWQCAKNSLAQANDAYHCRAAVEDHGEGNVITSTAHLIHRKTGVSYCDAFQQAVTLVRYCQSPAEDLIFKEVRGILDAQGGVALAV